MKYIPTPLQGAMILEPERLADERGFFARSWCRDDFRAHGLDPSLAQMNLSFNEKRGTLRGLHFQHHPHAEVKVVRCTRGRVLDVIVDLRTESPTFRQWFSVELTGDNYRMLYIPRRFAHGYQTLEDRSDVFYLVSTPYAPSHATGLMYDDSAFGIEWPLPVSVISEKDRSWEPFVKGLDPPPSPESAG